MSNQIEEQIRHIREFESHLGVTEGFFERLLAEDDWSFLIKLHALIEAATTTILVEALNKPELRDQLGRMPLSDSEHGKLSMLKSLGIVTKPYRCFIRNLSELRNQSVHNVRYTSLNLKDFFINCPKSKRATLAEALGVGLRGTAQDRAKLFEENPKGLIWISALCLISLFAVHKLQFDSDNKLALLGQEALRVVEGLNS